MLQHIKDHRKLFNGPTSFFSSIRLRHFSGHAEYDKYLDKTIRIAHLSDQHFGRVTPQSVQVEAIALALENKPDVVVLTGDFVCHSDLFLDDLISAIKLIKVPAFAVLGNHDYWTNAHAVEKALQKAGVEVLKNQHTTIKIGSQNLQIVGVDDAYTKHANVNQATKGMKKNVATLGLSHIAEEADHLWMKRVPLVLSGHTHGGQITVAGIHELLLKKIVGHKYIHGFYGDLKQGYPVGAVYVSAGIGAAVMPIRMGEKGKREVGIFDLGPTSSDEIL